MNVLHTIDQIRTANPPFSTRDPGCARSLNLQTDLIIGLASRLAGRA